MAQIEIKNSAGTLLAVFDQEYISGALDLEENQDTIKDPEIDRKINGDCILTFKVPATSDKIQYLTDENFIHADGKKFALVDKDCVKLIRDKGKLWLDVQAREAWAGLKNQHTTICNDITQDPAKDLDVIITRAGTTSGGYAAGSAGSALSWLLAGTGWTLTSADVTGTHDLKTSQESILGNIENVRDLWGGYQVWDSVAQSLNHLPESWAPDSGYEIRLGKNLKGLTRAYDYDFVTKLWVYGQNDVDILDVNVLNSGTAAGGGAASITLAAGASAVSEAYTGGWVYITGGTGSGQSKRISAYNGSTKVATVESNWTVAPDATSTYQVKGRFLLNFSYRSVIKSDVWRNQDITDPNELLTSAQTVHSKVAYPRYNYKLEHVDLRTLSEYSHESFAAGQYISAIDDILGIAVAVRVLRRKYNLFRPWMCDLELGDDSYELKQILADLEKKRRVSYRQARTGNTIVIADGSTTKNTRRADYIVPPGSTAAQDTINRAIGTLSAQGGKISLLEGTFKVINKISTPDNVEIEGQGKSTVIKVNDNAGTGFDKIFENSGTTNICLKNFKIDGNQANNVGIVRNGIYFNSAHFCEIMSIYATGCYGTSSTTGGAICLVTADHCKVIGCTAENTTWSGFYFWECISCTINANTSKSNTYGYTLDRFVQALADITMMGNTAVSNSSYGYRIYRIVGSNLSGNTSKQNGTGAYLYYCDKNNISGFIVTLNSTYGIYMYASKDNDLTSLTVTENSQSAHNTYDNIHLTADSDYNNIQIILCRRGLGAAQPRYGIRINSADCDGNVITNNDLITGGATASLSDGGSGTIVTAGNRL